MIRFENDFGVILLTILLPCCDNKADICDGIPGCRYSVLGLYAYGCTPTRAEIIESIPKDAQEL